jgi:rod shape-determining protein MreC
LEKKTGIIVAASALACAFAALWIAGGYAVAAEAVYPLEKSASWFQRHVKCRLRTLWRRQSYAAENASLRRENDILRMALQEAGRKSVPQKVNGTILENWLLAPVLSRGGTLGAKSRMRLGKGSFHGVVKGAAVAVPDGLVGRVTEVSPHTCVVNLITDPSVKVSCVIETGDPAVGKVLGIVSGNGTAAAAETDISVLYVVNPLKIAHLKNDFTPPPRALVSTSGLGGVFPKGITVGYLISGTRPDVTKLEREGDIAPAVDFPVLEEVFIHREN